MRHLLLWLTSWKGIPQRVLARMAAWDPTDVRGDDT